MIVMFAFILLFDKKGWCSLTEKVIMNGVRLGKSIKNQASAGWNH